MPVRPTPVAGLRSGTARLTEPILLTPGNLTVPATARRAITDQGQIFLARRRQRGEACLMLRDDVLQPGVGAWRVQPRPVRCGQRSRRAAGRATPAVVLHPAPPR